jgi:hypothetical protein
VFRQASQELFYKKCKYIKWTMCIGEKEGQLRACGHVCNVSRLGAKEVHLRVASPSVIDLNHKP